MQWLLVLLLLLLKSLFFNLSTRVCACACVCIPHMASTSLLQCTYTGWCHIKWRILKLNLPGSESSTAKEQLVTLEVNMYFTSCLSLPGSNKNTEGVCADSTSQALFIHSAQSSTQQSQDSAAEQQRLYVNVPGWNSNNATGEDEGKFGLLKVRFLHANSLKCI